MDNNSKVQLYGGGGHSKVVSEILEQNGLEVVSIIDDDSRKSTAKMSGVRKVGNQKPEHPIIVTIGDNKLRAEIVEMLDAEYIECVANSAVVSKSAEIGKGSVVLHGAILQRNAVVGDHVLINTAANVDHDNVLGDFVHISPNVALCGHVEIGTGTHVGAGATVIPKVKIGKWCKIGAGATVVSDIPDYSTAVGTPAKVIKQGLPSPEDSQGTPKVFDLALVGSGIASTFTLLHLISNLKCHEFDHPYRILLLERANHFHSGVAYGKRAGNKSLIITSLEDFLPPAERAEFVNWLNENKHWVFDRFRENAGKPAADWFESNARAIANNEWDNLFLPRYLFGEFIDHCAESEIQDAEKAGILTVEKHTVNVDRVERYGGPFQIFAIDPVGRESKFDSKRVVLGIGSPPFKNVFHTKAYSRKLTGLLIDNPYEKGMKQVAESMSEHVRKKGLEEVNILLVGSNASSIEVIFNICENAELMKQVGKVIVVSPSSEFPARFDEPDQTSSVSFSPVHLQQLVTSEDYTAKEIFLAAKADIFDSRDLKVPFRDSFAAISRYVIEAVRTLPSDEMQKFVDIYGVEIGRYQRRAGNEYMDVVDQLKASGKLQFLTGRFERIATQSSEGFNFDYTDVDGNTLRFDQWIQVSVNCTGFEQVSPQSTSPLITNLLKTGLCVANSSGMGFEVNEQMAASPDLYVVGPLLGGNIIGENLVWHAEHCGRIIKFAKQLSTHLTNELLSDPSESLQTIGARSTELDR